MSFAKVALIVLPALIALFFIEGSAGLKCFKCDGCKMNQTSSTGTKTDCPSTQTYCFTTRKDGKDYSGCAESCSIGKSGDVEWMSCCNSELCNSAEMTSAPFYAFVAAVSLAVFFVRK